MISVVKLRQIWFASLIIVILIAGIWFRFFNLDGKVYWHDEVYTSLRVAGYNSAAVIEEVFTGELVSPEDLLRFQHLNPEKGWKDTWKSLQEHPEHSPLYYLLLRFWQQLFGSSIAVNRSFSAVISLLVFPAIYWLCRELFNSPVVGWWAIALAAISPFQVLYAQEAREYSLWTVTTIICCATFLRAIRLQTKLSWLLYTITLALSLYTFLFSFFVAISHGLYVLLKDRSQWTQNKTYFLIAWLAGSLLFTPWIATIIHYFWKVQSQTEWTKRTGDLDILFKFWGLHFSSFFVDLGFPFESIYTYIMPSLIYLLLGCAIYFLVRNTATETWLFVVILLVIPALSLIIPDLVFGRKLSGMTRYFVPCYVAAQIAVAYLISSINFGQRKLWSAVVTGLIILGIISCVISSQSELWWNKAISYGNPQLARILNQLEQPVIISDHHYTNVGNLISLSYYLKPDAKFILVREPDKFLITDWSKQFLLLDPHSELLRVVKSKYSLSDKPFFNQGSVVWLVIPDPV